MENIHWYKGVKWGRIFIFYLILILMPGENIAKTIKSGIQSGIWSSNESPYIVTDDIIIPKGLTLTIEPGTIIKFGGPFRFIVAGALIVRGNLANRIIFTSIYDTDFGDDNDLRSKPPTSSDWYGIDFTDTSDDYLNVIDYSIIRYCKYGIRCRDASPLLTHIIFANIANSSVTIKNANIAIHSGVDFNYLTPDQRPVLVPVPEPPPETEKEKQKRLQKERYALYWKAKKDSIRKANKIKPIDTKCGILILDKNDIAHYGFDTFPEIISFLPGFINMASYWESSVLTSRGVFPGQFNNRILFLLNGVPIYDGITNSNYFEFIPIHTVERIEIQRGPDGAFWGKNAFAGVVNIITKQTEQPVKMITTSELGSFYTKKITSNINLSKSIFNLCIGTCYREDNGFWRTMDSDEGGNKFLLNSENDNYNLLISALSKNLNVVSSYYRRKQNQFGIIPLQKYSGLAKHEGLLLSLTYSKKITKDFSSTITARYNKTIQESEVGELGINNTNTNPPNFTISDGYIFQTEAKIKYNYKKLPTSVGFSIERVGAKNLLSLMDERNGDVLENLSIDPHPYRTEFSVFVFSGVNFSPFIGCIGGLRCHYLGEKSNYFLSPTIKLIYNPYASYNVQLSYRHGYRNSSLWERQIRLQDILYSAKKQLPEQIRSSDIELEYNISKWGKFDICGYWEFVSNLIQQRTLDANERIVFNASEGFIIDNSDLEYQILGGEISFQANISKDISMFINGAYQQLKDNKNNSTMQYWPNIFGNLNFNYQFNSNLLGSVYFKYIGRQTNEETETTITPCYLLNLKATLKLLSNVSLEVIVNNLLDDECFYAEFNRRKIPSIPGGYPRAFFFLLKTEF